jgi:thiol-disulfide isomerase/thioredoxin
MKSLVALMAIGLILPGVLAQDIPIQKMSEIDTSKGIIVLDFMATWCGPCRVQMDELKKVYEQYGDKIRIISVDVDARETEGLLAKYRKEVGAEWEFAIDDNGTFNAYKNFLNNIPTLVILKDGKMVYRSIGKTTSADLIKEIEKVL